ncbi:abhydrolase domain-containing protein 14A-like protein [Elysia marginata]|uniref:Abhydrolase domain-containing protein 14A-like protein n=1 Tax=Elysia marginata TaxID=1093978 RepID=A0AAV4FT76_9GAST|nr:abhydrolase domain-containing protein 14A-like protein [Elysia marginata]
MKRASINPNTLAGKIPRMATTVTNDQTSQESYVTLQQPSYASSLVKKEEKVNVSFSGQTVEVYTIQVTNTTSKLYAEGRALSVLFLHSGRFTSQMWIATGTLNLIANQGHRAVAIDLPGKGQTPGPIDRALYAEFMEALVKKLDLKRVVFVSPSSSGRYTLPYLFNDVETSQERAAGFVPIAPGGTQDFRDHYPYSNVRVFLIPSCAHPFGKA